MTALHNSSSLYLFYHIPKVFNWIQNQKRPLKNSEHIVMVMKPVWDDFYFVTWCIIMLKIVSRIWINCGHEEMHMIRNNTSMAFNQWWVVVKWPKVYREKPGLLTQYGETGWVHGVMLLGSMLVVCVSRNHQTRLHFFSLLLSDFGFCL